MKNKTVTIAGVSYTLNYNVLEDGHVECESLIGPAGTDCKDSVNQIELEAELITIQEEALETPPDAKEDE